MVCDFQNFYCKLEKRQKITNIWKQRPLTIIGKNLLINSLINSTFLFNVQIEIPPPDFLKIVDKQNKNSIIADYNEGGIRYKDLDCFVRSVNIKFLPNLTADTPNKCTILPQYWFNRLCKVPTTN